MNRVTLIQRDAVLLAVDDARHLAEAVYRLHALAPRHGGRVNPSLLTLAAQISSATGTPEPHELATNEPIEHELIDATTAAELLGCSPRNVRKLADTGKLPGNKIGNRWQFIRDDVEVFRDWRN